MNATVELITKNKALLVGALLSMIAVAVVYAFFYVPKSHEQSGQAAYLESLSSEQGANDALIRRVPNPDQAIEELRLRIERLKEQASSKEEIPRIVQQLAGQAAALDVEIVSIKPRDDLKAAVSDLPEGVSKVFIEVRLQTPFEDFGSYLASLDHLAMRFTVEDLTMEKPENAVLNLLDVRLIVSTYVLA